MSPFFGTPFFEASPYYPASDKQKDYILVLIEKANRIYPAVLERIPEVGEWGADFGRMSRQRASEIITELKDALD